MVEFGTRIVGITRQADENQALQVGKFYEVRVEASHGVDDAEGIANYLLSKLNEQLPEVQVSWMKVCPKSQQITFQFRTVPLESLGFTPRLVFSIGALLTWLPAILTLLGISIVAISIWDIIAGIPWYMWALLGTGVVLLIFGPAIANLFKARVPTRTQPIVMFPK